MDNSSVKEAPEDTRAGTPGKGFSAKTRRKNNVNLIISDQTLNKCQ